MFRRDKKKPDSKSTSPRVRRRRSFLSYKRRWLIWGSTFLLVGGVITYNVLTTDERVRARVESELSTALHLPVKIGHASFSLSKGLDIHEVSIYVDQTELADSRLIKAGQLHVMFDLKSLQRLRLQVDRVEASDVEVLLCEDMDSHTWNLGRMLRSQEAGRDASHATTQPLSAPELPMISLKGAKVIYARKTGGRLVPSGELQVDAGIYPTPNDRFTFSAVTRATGSDTSTRIIGSLSRKDGTILGRTSDLSFDDTLRRLLPSQVHAWFQDFQFAGKFAIPRFEYTFPRGAEPGGEFRVQLAFREVSARIRPEHWLARFERSRMQTNREAIRVGRMVGIDASLNKADPGGDASDDVQPLNLMSYLTLRSRSVPLQLDQVSGRATFTTQQVQLDEIRCRVQGQSLVVAGRLDGYDIDATAKLNVRTVPGTFMHIPPSRQFMAWAPGEVRTVYLQFKPDGKATFDLTLDRNQAGGPFLTTLVLDVFESQFQFEDMPYPLHQCAGRFVFENDKKTGLDLLYIQNLHGVGVPGTANEKSTVRVDGVVGPFVEGGAGVDVTVVGDNITSDRELRTCLPPEVRKALTIFGPIDYAQRLIAAGKREIALSAQEQLQWPRFYGGFVAQILRKPGPKQDTNTNITVKVERADGALKAFPYPMEGVSVTLKVTDDLLRIENLKMRRGPATLKIDGTVKFTDPANPDLQIAAINVPIGKELLNALPPTERSWLAKADLGGNVDIIGRVYLKPTVPGGEADVDFDLNLALRDASLLNRAGQVAFTGLHGNLFLKPARLRIINLAGTRGAGSVQVSGLADWQTGTPVVNVKLAARNLLFDKPLHDILPQVAREAWDQQQPEGTADIDLDYIGQSRLAAAAAPAAATTTSSPAPTAAVALAPATLTAGASSQPAEPQIQLTLRPLTMSATPKVFPYRLDDLQGEIVVNGDQVQLRDLRARHAASAIAVSGSGTLGDAGDFRLKVSGKALALDEELIAALPDALSDTLGKMQPTGEFDVQFDRLDIRTAKGKTSGKAPGITPGITPDKAPSPLPTTRPVDVDFDCRIAARNAGKNTGVPLTEINGSTHLTGEIRENRLTSINGTLKLDSFRVMGRQGLDLSATYRRTPYTQDFTVESFKTRFAGGTAAGAMTLIPQDDGPAQYSVMVDIVNADVDQAAGAEIGRRLHAQASASLSIEGILGDAASRRGRGDIAIHGQDMYEAPVMLGMFRMVNFALPVRAGVNDVRISYVLSGDRVTFENIELSSPGLRIYGDGFMDFTSRKMNFTLNTENPDGLEVWLVGPVLKRVKEDLFQIRVRGTIAQPEVKGEALPTFRATLDEVIKDVQRKR